VGLALVYFGIAVTAPRVVGLWQDDAIYVATAKSLAQGTGYRHVELPEAPYQTKYPLLYPALLAPAFWIAAYPRNLPLLLAPTALAGAMLVGLSILYWRRVWGAPRAYALWVGTLAAASPVLVEFVRYTMSDLVYGAFAVATLYCVDSVVLDDTQNASRRRAAMVGAAAFLALAVLTRSIGVTLLAGCVAVALYRRQVWAAVGIGAPALAALAGWWGWQGAAGRANRSIGDAFLAGPELGYAMWLPSGVGDVLRVGGQNLFRSTEVLGDHLALPAGLASHALTSASAWTVCVHVLCYAAALLALAGFASTLRTRLRAVHVYAVLYGALVLAWPFDPGRFLLPWAPFVLYFLLEGVRRLGWSRGPAVVAVVLALAFATEDLKILASDDESYYLRELPDEIDLRERRQVEQWIRENVSGSQVVASPIPAGIYLETGRQGHFLWPDHDPYALYAGSDRQWTQLYALHSPSEALWLLADMRQHLEPAYAQAGIDYFVENDYGIEALILARTRPSGFSLAFQSRGGSMRIYSRESPPVR